MALLEIVKYGEPVLETPGDVVTEVEPHVVTAEEAPAAPETQAPTPSIQAVSQTSADKPTTVERPGVTVEPVTPAHGKDRAGAWHSRDGYRITLKTRSVAPSSRMVAVTVPWAVL